MKNIFIHTIIISVLALSLVSCEKENPVGPNLEDLYGSFRITDSLSNNPTVDFTTDGNVQFLGDWSLITDWKLEIVGRTSGSVKTITGKSKTLDTLIGQWNGTSDGLFFKQEKCDVTLTFPEHPDTMRSTVTISKVHDYKNDGILLADFETAALSFNMSGNTTLAQRDNTFEITPQGSYCYNLKATEPGNAWWLGGFSAITAKALLSVDHFPFIEQDTATTYVNFFAYGYGYEDSSIDFTFKEDDNNDGTCNENTEDAWSHKVTIVSPGWNKISFPLSALTNSKVGNGKLEINKISILYISLMSNGTARANIGCAVDFIIITQGKPL